MSVLVGDNTIEPNDDGATPQFYICQRAYVAQNCSTKDFNFYCGTAGIKAYFAVYSDVNGSIGSLLCKSGLVTLSAGWTKASLPVVSLQTGYVWLCWTCDQQIASNGWRYKLGGENYYFVWYGGFDDFGSAIPSDGTSGSGTYSVYLTCTLISTGTTLNGSSTAEALITADGSSKQNYAVTVRGKIPSASVTRELSVVLRWQDNSNFYWLGLGCWGHQYSISKVIAGNYQELTSSGNASANAVDTEYTLKAVVSGNLLQLYVNGTLVLQFIDSSISASGLFGIRTFNGSVVIYDAYSEDVVVPVQVTITSSPITGVKITLVEVN